jgi:hypothetical protein
LQPQNERAAKRSASYARVFGEPNGGKKAIKKKIKRELIEKRRFGKMDWRLPTRLALLRSGCYAVMTRGAIASLTAYERFEPPPPSYQGGMRWIPAFLRGVRAQALCRFVAGLTHKASACAGMIRKSGTGAICGNDGETPLYPPLSGGKGKSGKRHSHRGGRSGTDRFCFSALVISCFLSFQLRSDKSASLVIPA